MNNYSAAFILAVISLVLVVGHLVGLIPGAQ